MNRLDYIVTDNTKTKNKCDDVIGYEPKSDNKFILSSGPNMDPLPVATDRIRGDKKHREKMNEELRCLWNSEYTNITIKVQHTWHYERNIRSSKVDYSTAIGPYCKTQKVKVEFCMPDFSISKTILYHFHADKNEGESSIVYDMIIILDVTVQLYLLTDFKNKVLQWDGAAIPMKEHSGLLWQTS